MADEIETSADEADAAATEGTMAAWSSLPSEPIEASTYNALCEILGKAVDALSGGQAPYEHADSAEPIEPGTGYPPDKAKALTAVKTVLDKVPEGEPYRFSLDDLGTNAGVTEVTALLDGAGSDKKLVRATTAPGVPDEKPAKTTPKAKREEPPAEEEPAPKSKGEAFTKKPAPPA